jgi:hypothetical protein
MQSASTPLQICLQKHLSQIRLQLASAGRLAKRILTVFKVSPRLLALRLHCTVNVRPDQVRRIDIDYRQAKGPCYARALVQKLWAGEEFCLQIDSHMRFAQGWDDYLKAQLLLCPTEKAVLTAYPGISDFLRFAVSGTEHAQWPTSCRTAFLTRSDLVC